MCVYSITYFSKNIAITFVDDAYLDLNLKQGDQFLFCQADTVDHPLLFYT